MYCRTAVLQNIADNFIKTVFEGQRPNEIVDINVK